MFNPNYYAKNDDTCFYKQTAWNHFMLHTVKMYDQKSPNNIVYCLIPKLTLSPINPEFQTLEKVNKAGLGSCCKLGCNNVLFIIYYSL